MEATLAEAILASSRRHPDETALIGPSGPMAYGAFEQAVLSVAHAMRSDGISPGDPVALCLPNGAAFTVAYVGALVAGAVVVPLSVLATDREITNCLSRVRARLLVTHAPGEAVGVKQVWSAEDLESAATRDPRPEVHEGAPDDVAVILFTSGTTGRPKGVMLTHANLVSNARWVCHESLGRDGDAWGPGHVTLARLPLSHSFAQTTMQNAPLLGGAAISYASGPFDAEATLSQLARDRVTVAAMVPTMAAALADHPGLERYDLRAFRYALVGGAPIPEELFDRFERRLGAEIVEGYGLTETSPVCAFRTPDAPRRSGSVGKPAAGARFRVVDRHGRACSAGSAGELLVGGDPVFKGYFEDDAATSRAMNEGWLRTGDLGMLDADGHVYVFDRKSDTIIRNGYNVYPSEVEDVLLECACVADAAVVGEADDRVGEEVVAWIVPDETEAWDEAAVRNHCTESLSAYKRPRRFVLVDALPRGGKGQLLRHVLRARVEAPGPGVST